MSEPMGTFRIDAAVENPARAGARQQFQSVLVDTGAELSVFPADALEILGIERLRRLRFRQADGTILVRWTGSARIYAANTVATDDVVFGEPGDITLLGARSLEGLNVRIDPVSRRLVDAGPLPLAANYGEVLGGQAPAMRLLQEMNSADWPENMPADVGLRHDRHVCEANPEARS